MISFERLRGKDEGPVITFPPACRWRRHQRHCGLQHL